MKQYRITSADFVTPGETLDPDAVLSEEDKAYLSQFSSPINTLPSGVTYAGTMADLRNTVNGKTRPS